MPFGSPNHLTFYLRAGTGSDEEIGILGKLQVEIVELRLRLKSLRSQRKNIKLIANDVCHRFELRRAQCNDLESRCDMIVEQANTHALPKEQREEVPTNKC